jgi:hypothetical protein
MKNLRLCRLCILNLICYSLFSVTSFSQNSVGIGTANSNNHAVLELVSPNKNQGFLVPRLTTAQRTAATFTSSLATTENGLLVYDSDLNSFFHWLSNQWSEIGKAQDLSLVGNTLKITNNPNATTIDLSPYAGTNTDNQTLSLAGPTLSITGGNSVNLSSINTDNQNLSNTVTGTQRTINISGGTGTTIDVADNDNSITNEIQNLTNTVSGTQRTINISGGTGATIDVADNDNSVTNEIQTLSITGSTLSISGSGGNSVTLPTGGGITGSGATDQVTFWGGTSSITGSNNFIWDSKKQQLNINGGQRVAYSAPTADYIITDTDYIINVKPSVKSTITLPDASVNKNRVLIIRTTGTIATAGNTLDIIIGTASNRIDGNNKPVTLSAISGNLYSITLVSDGGINWYSINKSIY